MTLVGRHYVKLAACLCVLLFGALSLLACGSTEPNDEVTRESIVEVDSLEPVANGGFDSDLEGWTVANDADLEVGVAEGDDGHGNALTVEGDDARVREPVTVSQEAQPLPDLDKGVQYILTFEARTQDLSRDIPVELRADYAGDDEDAYEFFTGGPNNLTTGIPEGTSDWTEMSVRAVARQELDALQVFAVDIPEGKFSGTVMVDDFSLREVGTAR